MLYKCTVHVLAPPTSCSRNLRVAECIVMLLGQVAVELRGAHMTQVTGIFQQRLFHPTSNLDGNIVRELGKMAAKTGVCANNTSS